MSCTVYRQCRMAESSWLVLSSLAMVGLVSVTMACTGAGPAPLGTTGEDLNSVNSLQEFAIGHLVHAPNASSPGRPCPNPPSGWSKLTSNEYDGAQLQAWVRSPPEPRGTVLVLHGIRDHKASYLPFGENVVKKRFRAVLVDLRGHGCSTGRFLTYGAKDGADLRILLDVLTQSLHGDLAIRNGLGPVGVVGVSYGSAAALSLAAQDERVRAVVSVAGPASLLGLMRDFVRGRIPGPLARQIPDSHLQDVLAKAGERAGFDPHTTSMTDWASETSARILIVHGKEDQVFRLDHAHKLLEAAQGRAELRIRDGKDHRTVLDPEYLAVNGAILDWLDRTMVSPR